MSSNIAIEVYGLGKKYRVGAQHTKAASYKRLTETIADVLKSPFRRLSAGGSSPSEEFWALKDVSFTVPRGEVLGVIGRNGAGKSTLLKILSRVTTPTEGRARMHGRIGSLLEVGTGFHPELTGRENIYLNGTILGMRKVEIDRNLDQIIAFAEIERFLDTPVKRYSSGMYVRLAFAVAAHLETEILLVDEVLAVGDAAFQKKCLGKMQDVAGQGRTILFVSHSMPALQSLCTRAIVLLDGSLFYSGSVDQAVREYMSFVEAEHDGLITDLADKRRFGSGELRLLKFWLEDQKRKPVANVPTGTPCCLAVEYEASDGRSRTDVGMSIHINTVMGAPITLVNTYMKNQDFSTLPPKGIIRLELPRIPLTAGRYIVDLNIATHAGNTYADFIKGAASFDVIDGDPYGTGRPGNPGVPVVFDGEWHLDEC